METNMTTKTKPDITAADIARELKVSPREARAKLRAAGFKAPYSAKDVAKMRAVIKGDKPKAATAKPVKRRSETRVDYPSD
jgi:MoxR-like ATPase